MPGDIKIGEKKRKVKMMKITEFLVIGLLFLSGCSNCLVSSTRGTVINTRDLDKIIVGKTTKAEVIGLFGIPDQVISKNSSDIDIQESTQRDRARYDRDRASLRASGGVDKSGWHAGGGGGSGVGHGTGSGDSYSKSTSISTPASAIASMGTVFVYRRIEDKTWNLRFATFESTTAKTLTVVFDEMDIVLSYNYND